jgi:hypothetical protein
MINIEFQPGGNIIYHFYKTLYQIDLEKKWYCINKNYTLNMVDSKNYTYNNTNVIIDDESKNYFYGLYDFKNFNNQDQGLVTNFLADLVILKFTIKETSTSSPITTYRTIYASETYPPYLSDYRTSCPSNDFEYAYIPYFTFNIDYDNITHYGFIISTLMYTIIYYENKCIFPNIKKVIFSISGRDINNTNVSYNFEIFPNNQCSYSYYNNCKLCENKYISGCFDCGDLSNYSSNLEGSVCSNSIYSSPPSCWNSLSPYYISNSAGDSIIHYIDNAFIILESLSGQQTIDNNMYLLLGFNNSTIPCSRIPIINNRSNIILFEIGNTQLISQCITCT